MNVPSQFNGNISGVTWQVAGRNKQAYGFKYDDLDRLTESNYFDLTDVNSAGTWNSNYSTDNKFMEKQTYDLRGNITSLKRNGLNGGSWTSNGYTAATYGLIDDLAYSYDQPSSGQINQNNRLLRVTDNSLANKGFKYFNARQSSSDTDYGYDYNGNLIFDKHKGISEITYNYLNLPMVITFTGNLNRSIKFVYDASGVKLQKITIEKITDIRVDTTTYDYVNGVEYRNGVLQRLAHTEGAVTRQVHGTTGAVSYNHEYVLRDHLGNARVSFTDGVSKGDPYIDWNLWQYVDPNVGNTGYNDGVITQDDIKTINNYYPFGMDMEGNWNGSFDAANSKYKFNEKEWNNDFGLGWYDYGARFYDPAAPHWMTIDPLAEKMRRHSPYNYAFDNPMRFVDPDGMQSEDWVKGKDGKIYNDFEVTSKREALAKDVEYIGNNKLLLDKSTNVAYFLPFCSSQAECWGQLGETATITESRNAPAIRFGNPDYEPYNPEAVGFQVSGSVDFIASSYSVSLGVALGPDQAGVFMTTGAGTGPFNLKSPLSGSLSASVFLADRTDSKQDLGLVNLLKDGTSVSGTAGVFTGGYFQSASKGTLKPTDGYKGVNFGLSTPGGGIKVERTYTRGLIWKTN